jgi:hypothetical protein
MRLNRFPKSRHRSDAPLKIGDAVAVARSPSASLRLHGTPCYNIRVLFAARVPLSSQVSNCDEIRHSDANGTGETAMETATWTMCFSFLDRRARGANYLRLVSHVVRSFVARRRPGAPANFGIKITGAGRVILLCERSCRPTTHRAL